MWKIRAEREGDEAAVEALADAGFGPGRYAKSAYRLREGVAPERKLSFVAEEETSGELLGSVRFWPIAISGRPSLLLGPLAVRPGFHGQGIGLNLMKTGLDAAKALGYQSVILVGDEPYYARAGFKRLNPGQVIFPGPVDKERILGIHLQGGSLDDVAGKAERARIDIPVSAQGASLG
jgi:predicted N-acetyltransferase YhbS